MAGPGSICLAPCNYSEPSGVASRPNSRPLFRRVPRYQNCPLDEEIPNLAAGRVRLLVSVIARSHQRSRFHMAEPKPQRLVFQVLKFLRSIEARDRQMIA